MLNTLILAAMDTKEMLRRTKKFGYDCIDLCEYLEGSFLRNHIRGQLIRSSSSVTSNYRAARLAQTEASRRRIDINFNRDKENYKFQKIRQSFHHL